MTDKNKEEKKFHEETIALHGGQEPDPSTGARAVPIYQTTSYNFRDSRHAADLFALTEPGNIYTRLMNPTTDVFEKRMALLDGGVGALAVASGQAAITIAILNIAQTGDEIVSADNLYGGTYNLFHNTFARMGIKVNFIDSQDIGAFEKAINKKTKAIYAESMGNPKLDVTDFEKISAIAKKNRIPFILDNTVSPYIFKPFEHGVDIAVYSATKFIGGHGTSLGGVIVDSGNFNWEKGDFPLITAPEPGYHGLEFVKALREQGNIAYITKARLVLLRDLGPCISPFNSFLMLQGLETLPIRMERHCKNALSVAGYLREHKYVSWVNYPGLDDSPQKAKVDKYLGGRAGAIIGFGIKGGSTAGARFIDSLKLISHLANIGDAKTLAIHPASTTHQQLSEEERISTGVTSDFIRLSVGLENIEDIFSDLDQALAKSQK